MFNTSIIISFLISAFTGILYHTSEDLPVFEGDIYFEQWEGTTITHDQITDKMTKIEHPLLLEEIKRYQVSKEFIVESSIKYSESEIHSSSKVQWKNHQKIFLTAPPTSTDSTSLRNFFKNGGMLPHKYKRPLIKLKRTKHKKNILGLECRKFTHETMNKYTGKEYKIEYWIQENLKFLQYKHDGSFGEVFKEEGAILEKVALMKPNMDTSSRMTLLEIRIKDQKENPFQNIPRE